MLKESKTYSGFILLESIVAFLLVTIVIFVYQTGQVQLLKQNKQNQTETQMIRTLYEEVREQRITQTNHANQIEWRDETFAISTSSKKASISNGTITLVIANED